MTEKLRTGAVISNSLVIDLCCGGGVLGEAFYDSVGLDMNRDLLKYYQNMKVLGDATKTPFRKGSTIFSHGSPPCQKFSSRANKEKHVDIVDQVRKELKRISKKYTIENVVAAPIRKDLMLCQSMFGLPGARHRNFEIQGFPIIQPRCKEHNHIYRNDGKPYFAHTKGKRSRNQEFLGCRDLPVEVTGLGVPPSFMKYILKHLDQENTLEVFF